ncbi:MAG: SRPBCC family protein [Micrococcales bacterium]|nr:SRPBCC family protein [Micrococcales bacterium]
MSSVERHCEASPAEVWAVLANGWTYGSWVVGASRVRAVDPSWPAVGACVHHSIGTWPAVLNDNTEVVHESQHLVMMARTRPVGQARVEITVTPEGDGTRIRIVEDFVSGPATVVPRPARHAALKLRNTETLYRLALLAERREQPE